MRALPFSLVLSAVRWDVFATLTFRREVLSLDSAVNSGLEWLGKVRVRMRLPVAEFYWFLRPERGELGGRVHLHALLRVRPEYRSLFVVGPGFLPAAHRLWGLGRTSFRAVEGTFDPATWYLQLEKTSGADEYETEKTAACRHGIPSDALLVRASRQESSGKVVLRGPEKPSSTLAQNLVLA